MTFAPATTPFDDMIAELADLTAAAAHTADQLQAALAGPRLANEATAPIGEWLHAIALTVANRAATAHSVLHEWAENTKSGSDYPYPEPPPELVQRINGLRAEFTDDEVAAAIVAIMYPRPGADA